MLFFICLEMKTEWRDWENELKDRKERERKHEKLNCEKKKSTHTLTQNGFIEKYYFYYLHIPHNIFSFYSETMKFNKLKYHLIFLRQAAVQGFEGSGGSILLQFSFIQGNCYYNPLKKQCNIWAADNHLLQGQRNQKRIMKWNRNRYSKDKRWKTNLVDMKKDTEPHFLS